jgi:alkylation response protein AidB-like acyl-CoA dehydrogenase
MEGPIVIFAKDDETNFPTGFLVEKFCPGYSVSEPWHKIGMRGGTMTDVYLKDVRVPAANMIGPKGQGYWVLQAGIAFGKIGVSSGALGGMQAALDLCVKYAKEKQHRDRTIAKFQGVQMDIAKIAEKTEAARWLCYRLGYLAETSKDLRLFAKEAALTKSFVTEAAVDVSRLAVAVHGSYGVMQDYAVERIYRDMIIGEQVEGVADLQRVITASILLG